MEKQRNISLDIIRILACCMVVLMHSPLPGENATGTILTPLSYCTAPCIGLFFMVSGALLLPAKTDYLSFIKRRFSKIAVPTIIWSLIYIATRLYDSESEVSVLQSLASIPFTPQEGVLWFMYTLAGLYLVAPVVSAWLTKATKRELEIVLSLWGISLCYPILVFWLTPDTSTTGILYYFSGYLGYFVLGFYLKRYPKSFSTAGAWLVAISGIVLIFLLKRFNIDFDFYHLFWYESIFIASFCVAIWKTIHCLTKNRKMSSAGMSRLALVSNLSFGVYLIHILIMHRWLWNTGFIIDIHSYLLQTIVIAIATIFLSFLSCLMICRLPYSQWIIGFYHKGRAHITQKQS